MSTSSVKYKVYLVSSNNPYVNLAFEDHLLRTHIASKSNAQILILWQSSPSIVMGKFQNPWLECQVGKVNELGINLVRRQSGGGCVYHDLGNMNYSFISPKSDYNKSRNAGIIVDALKSLGINAFENERHDLRVIHDNIDYKISGCAFKETKHSALHHGTLLINADTALLNELLRSKFKSEAALGVKSVRSSVTNIQKLLPELTKAKLTSAIIKSFSPDCEIVEIFEQDICMIEGMLTKVEELKSWQWILGSTPKFSLNVDGMELTIKNARVIAVDPQTDESETLINLVIDKKFYEQEENQLGQLSSYQSDFINKCYNILYI